MKVREWDPRTASATEITSLVALLNEVSAVDLPDDPLWHDGRMRDYLSVTMPGERKTMWLVEETAGDAARGVAPLGAGSILLLGDIGVVEILVHPKARRQQIGRALLTEQVRLAHSEGFDLLGVEVAGGTCAVDFYQAYGFTLAFTEIRSLLSLNTVDWFTLGDLAAGVGAGYQIEFYPGGPPDHLIAAYAAAKAEVRDDYELGDLELRPSSYEPQRLQASLNTLDARGLKLYVVVAVVEKTGEIAGLTEVVVPAQRPGRADQYDTVVVPRHRGYGVGRAIKARMLFELRSAEPKLTEVQTWNAAVNEPLIKVNQELGFIADRAWLEYEGDVAALAQRLGIVGSPA
ncbi:GNAT family N-acetyltransferase [Catellatospora sp. KI3]|uniref:GNAT family N-acetyltransferase n=1 Tax=Catellatospora sp. KI3 TaxID=3041620 RepID=UPI002482C365|nr:GNAT family N-acetyltransferase [Catellatospora sp. KI3]MDI1460148.1 GNAT family N-acetyltransferase [Catellatospora sp. KI3]